MSEEAIDLINRMIQIEPQNRLGHNLESIGMLKEHPFFKDIDFLEISHKKYKGVYNLLQKKVTTAIANNDDSFNYNYFHMFVPNKDVKPEKKGGLEADAKGIVLKGHLQKKNWYGNK